jgi:hypothetical protein
MLKFLMAQCAVRQKVSNFKAHLFVGECVTSPLWRPTWDTRSGKLQRHVQVSEVRK